MTAKAEFNAEEWSTLVGAPLLAAMMVIAADRGGSVRETLAVARAYAEARETHDGELMSALLAGAPAPDARQKTRGREQLGRDATLTLREAVAILERVATQDEVVAYKRFVFSLAETAARAHREGGFLGVGGSEISAPEQAALDAIAAVFDEPPEA
jgi:hypothetical protein